MYTKEQAYVLVFFLVSVAMLVVISAWVVREHQRPMWSKRRQKHPWFGSALAIAIGVFLLFYLTLLHMALSHWLSGKEAKELYIAVIPFNILLALATMLVAWGATTILGLLVGWNEQPPGVPSGDPGKSSGGLMALHTLVPLVTGIMGVTVFVHQFVSIEINDHRENQFPLSDAIVAFTAEQKAAMDIFIELKGKMNVGAPPPCCTQSSPAPITLNVPPQVATDVANIRSSISNIEQKGLTLNMPASIPHNDVALCALNLTLRQALFDFGKYGPPDDGCSDKAHIPYPSLLQQSLRAAEDQLKVSQEQRDIAARAEVDAMSFPWMRFQSYSRGTFDKDKFLGCVNAHLTGVSQLAAFSAMLSRCEDEAKPRS